MPSLALSPDAEASCLYCAVFHTTVRRNLLVVCPNIPRIFAEMSTNGIPQRNSGDQGQYMSKAIAEKSQVRMRTLRVYFFFVTV